VAVSEAAWGGFNKAKVCFQQIQIRNRNNPSTVVKAYIVDFCPTEGCLWAKDERQFNTDLYGQDTWNKLGGEIIGGTIDIEVKWPPGLVPNGGVLSVPSLLRILVLGLGMLII
jgi:hypothetical protein